MTEAVVNGWLQGVRQLPSPNFNARPTGCEVNLLVIHNISLPPGKFGGDNIDKLFLNMLDPSLHSYFASIAAVRVSAHLLIDRLGLITQYVSLLDRAWHAGKSAYGGVADCNDFSIGIELEGTDELPYTSQQYDQLGAVCAAIFREFPGIGRDRLVGHCDIAPDRKTDPGPSFDWDRLHAGLNRIGAWNSCIC